jgi:[acyl-carrier-protein] S-malonyltransferase
VGIDGRPTLAAAMDIVLLFPGQGSQKPGMGKDIADSFSEARDVFATVDEALDFSLSSLCFEGPTDDLTLTHNAQPALLAHGAAVWSVAREALARRVQAAAGHSLGEFTAYVAAGSFSVAAGAKVVRRRGELMYDSGIKRPGAMAAILGDLARPIEDVCAQASGEAGLVVPANYNAPGQIVVSGEVGGVERAMTLAKDAGAKRTIRLNVSGAFHSPLMAVAKPGLASALDAAPPLAPRFAVFANVTAEAVTTAERARELLLEQLTSPVRWTDEVRALAEQYPDALFVEMGPGAVLTGLVKKIAPSVRTATCGTAGEIEGLLELVA